VLCYAKNKGRFMVEILDAKTIFVLTTLFSALFTVVFYSIYRGVYSVVAGVLSFAWAYGLFTFFTLLLLSRSYIHPIFSVVLADTALCLSLLLIVDGISRLKGYALHVRLYRWYVTICLILFAIFTFHVPSLTMRVLLVISSIVILFSLILWLLLQETIKQWRLGEWLLSVSMLTSVSTALILAINQVQGSQKISILAYQGAQSQYLTMNLLATVFIAFGLIVMTQDCLRKDLERIASYDSLTGVLTRRVILSLLDKSMAKVSRSGKPLALMMLDLDHFKRINDSYGHTVGDKVLREVIAVVEGALRKDAYLGRYGGEEFIVVMPDTDLEQLREVSERVRRVVAETPVITETDSIRCTISIGAMIIDADNVDSLLDPVTTVDKIMYQAKVHGRNQVVI
jgi:diguanylate cyclase (GGDEF)-like protein